MARTTVRSKPNAGTKGVPRGDREAQILDEASREFGQRGFAATSVADIAARAGISKPLIYTYFGSKEGLFTACVHRAGTVVADEIERIARENHVGLERGRRTLDGLFTILEPQPGLWRLFFDPTAPQSGLTAEAMAHYANRISSLTNEGVAEMLQLSGSADSLDVSALVAIWSAIVDSLVAWWVDHPDQTAAQMSARCLRLVTAVYASAPQR